MHYRVVIIGTGFSGLCAAIKLKKAGITDFVLLERATDIGGTWRDNVYPGCCCDIQSNLYSFSFEQNPDWSRAYPPQDEIQQYLLGVCDKHDLRQQIEFSTEVSELRYDEANNTWRIITSGAAEYTSDIVINGSGILSEPAFPDIAGLEDFEGETFHSAEWNHDYDLNNRRIAVIGTGASAIQFVPQVAPIAKQTYVFQRTPPWVIPRNDRPVSSRRRRIFRAFPILQRLLRWKIYLRQELLAFGFINNGRGRLARRITDGGKEFIAATISDPDLRAVVTPDYAPGCKRLLISNDWYPTLSRTDVDLVTTDIAEIRPGSIITRDGAEREIDTILFGTGFKATEFLAPMKVFGIDGLELSETWQDGAATHLGITMNAFPNLFLLVGPNTGLGHNSIVLMIEAQMNYIMGAIKHLQKHPGVSLNLKVSVQKTTYDEVQAKMSKTVWASGCNSWYLSDDGRNDTLWPGFTIGYWRRTKRFKIRDYEELREPVTNSL